jgi:hypothetical protein
MQSFTIEFSGTDPNTRQRVKRQLRVTASDWAAAIDACKAKYRKLDAFLFPVFNFNESARVSSRSVSRRVARNAGPDEE